MLHGAIVVAKVSDTHHASWIAACACAGRAYPSAMRMPID